MDNNYVEWSVIAGETPTATKWNILGDNDSDFHTRLQKVEGVITSLTDDTIIDIDMDAGYKFKVTIAGNRTLTISNVNIGQPIILRIKQDGTGSRTVSWFSGISWDGGVTPTLSTSPNKIDVFGFIPTGASAFDGFVVGSGLA